jgi:hypothetical protein
MNFPPWVVADFKFGSMSHLIQGGEQAQLPINEINVTSVAHREGWFC